MKILLVEDDDITATALADALTAHQFLVTAVGDGRLGLDLAERYEYDLMVLDVVMPGLDGISLCRKLRAKGCQTPILLLTARDGTSDRVLGLEAGADDYVVKPYELPELVARIRALLRRGSAIALPLLCWGKVQLDPTQLSVHYDQTLVRLTPKEFGLLELFLRHPHRIFSRSALLDHVWSDDEFPGEDAVTTQIKGLRQKLRAAGMQENLLETVYGMGYRLKAAPIPEETAWGEAKAAVGSGRQSENSTGHKSSQREAAPTPRDQAEQKVRDAIAMLREDLKITLVPQLEMFTQVTEAIAHQTLSSIQQQEAFALAHRLVGTLGAVGLIPAARVMIQIERLLQPGGLASEQGDRLLTLLNTLQQTLKPLQDPPPSSPIATVPPTAPTLASTAITTSAPVTRLLVIDPDSSLTAHLQTEAPLWNFVVEVTPDLGNARNLLLNQHVQLPIHFQAILLDLSVPDNRENGLSLLEELSCQHPTLPVIVMTDQHQLTERVEVARRGGRGVLQKPASAPQVFETVVQTLQLGVQQEARLLIVDDDPAVLAQLQLLLVPWGFQVTTLENPEEFWEVLEATSPDLLVLDVEMPGFSGVELCQVVRGDSRWAGLPVLFLSACADLETVHQVFAVGADDYITKPIAGPELVARVLNRLERMQILRRLARNQPLGPLKDQPGKSLPEP